MRKFPWVALPLIFIQFSQAAESKGAGSTLFPFLKIPVSARAAALGGTLGAADGDAGGIDTHMAGLASLRRTDIQATYISYFEDTSLQSVILGFPVSLSAHGKMPVEPKENEFPTNQLVLGFEYRAFKASDKGFSASDNPLDEFDVKDQLLEVGLAYPITNKVSFGLTGKSVSSKIQGKSLNANAFDGSVLAKLNPRWNGAVSIQNVGNGKKYNGSLGSTEYGLPLTYRGSVGYKFSPKVLLVADVARSQDEVLRTSGGIEWALIPILHLRAGVLHHTTLEFSGGLGLNINGPQKTNSSPSRPIARRAAGGKNTTLLSPMATQILNTVPDKLVAAYQLSEKGKPSPSITVLPFNSSDKVTLQIHKTIQSRVSQKTEFKFYEEKSNSDYIVSGNVTQGDEKYSITCRLIRMEDGETIAMERVEIATEDMFESKRSLENTAPAVGASDSLEPRVNLGFDYGLATNKELGFNHTVTFKILY